MGCSSVSKKEDGLLENVRLVQQGEITLEEALCFCERRRKMKPSQIDKIPV